jgi:DNA-binding transcriptional MerR regulator
MLSISEFSEMCHLSPQALRFYHTEGLLVPAQTDERTGYRSYAFEQVEQAMLVTLLRDTGMSVKLVRQALDEPDLAPALLDRHDEETRLQRAAQDEAIRAARTIFDTQPQARPVHVPAMTVVAATVPGTPPGRNVQEWEETEALIEAAAADLVASVRDAGLTPVGRPWRMLAFADDRRGADGVGPVWSVRVPVAAPAEPPAGLVLLEEEARDEMSIFIPGRNTMAKYCTGIVRLLNAHPAEGGGFVDITRLRQEIHEDGVLSSAPVEQPRD